VLVKVCYICELSKSVMNTYYGILRLDISSTLSWMPSTESCGMC